MTFIEWLKFEKGYDGDGSAESIQAESIQAEYSAGEIDFLYEEYSEEYGG